MMAMAAALAQPDAPTVQTRTKQVDLRVTHTTLTYTIIPLSCCKSRTVHVAIEDATISRQKTSMRNSCIIVNLNIACSMRSARVGWMGTHRPLVPQAHYLNLLLQLLLRRRRHSHCLNPHAVAASNLTRRTAAGSRHPLAASRPRRTQLR